MKLIDTLRMAFNSLVNRKLRSWLTILGIVIGVAAVVALVSIGQGLQDSVQKQLSSLGSDIIFIQPQHARGEVSFGRGPAVGQDFTSGGVISGNLTDNDLRLIKSIPGVFVASGVLNRASKIKRGSEIASINIQGTDPSLQKVFSTVILEEGRYLLSGDDRVTVVGYNVAHQLFKEPLNANGQIQISGQNFRIVGIMKQTGQAAPTDNLVVLPMIAARRVFSDFPKDQYSAIAVKLSSGADPDTVAKQIEAKLFLSHHVTKDTQDFSVQTSKSILDTVGKVLSSIKVFLGGIAAISLLVGGIGIANTMFMSVLERTRQIGILKAIGATYLDVMQLFLAESAIMGLIGGIFGVLLGLVASAALSKFGFGPGSQQGISASVTPSLALFAIGFSVLIGVISGILPARKAANLQPIEALRYE